MFPITTRSVVSYVVADRTRRWDSNPERGTEHAETDSQGDRQATGPAGTGTMTRRHCFWVVKPSGARSWVQRLVIGSQRCDFGLGSAAWRTLREAREMARENRRIARRGGDPLAERRKAKTPTFAQAAEQVIALHSASWKDGGKTAALWGVHA